MITILAVVLCAGGFLVAGRCMLHNFDPERVKARNVVGHTAVVIPLQAAAGLCFTYGQIHNGVSFGYAFKLSMIITPSLIVLSAFVCIVPALFAAVEQTRESERNAGMLRVQQPWDIKSTDVAAAPSRSTESVLANTEALAADDRVPVAA